MKKNTRKGKFALEVTPTGDAAYVYLPNHPGSGKAGVVAVQVRLKDVYPNYDGPDIHLDLNQDRQLIGIDIMA